ncbi:MAG TPA: hypothetical protein VGC56_08745, partial [Allosphingosinicella sp.]
ATTGHVAVARGLPERDPVGRDGRHLHAAENERTAVVGSDNPGLRLHAKQLGRGPLVLGQLGAEVVQCIQC